MKISNWRPRIFICILSLPFLLPGCTTALKTIYGIKQPQVETKESLFRYLSAIGSDTCNVVTVDTSFYLKTLKRLKGFPEAEVFDGTGAPVRYKPDSIDCNAGLSVFLPHLLKNSSYGRDSNYTLDKHCASLTDLYGNKIDKTQIGAADYYLFIYWTKWTGRLNKNHVKVWEDLARSNHSVNLKVIKVDLDYQSWWSEQFRKQIEFGFSKR